MVKIKVKQTFQDKYTLEYHEASETPIEFTQERADEILGTLDSSYVELVPEEVVEETKEEKPKTKPKKDEGAK